MSRIKIAMLKRRARALYLEMHSGNDLSCGAHLADFIRPSLAKAEAEFEAVMAQLRELDPAAPR